MTPAERKLYEFGNDSFAGHERNVMWWYGQHVAALAVEQMKGGAKGVGKPQAIPEPPHAPHQDSPCVCKWLNYNKEETHCIGCGGTVGHVIGPINKRLAEQIDKPILIGCSVEIQGRTYTLSDTCSDVDVVGLQSQLESAKKLLVEAERTHGERCCRMDAQTFAYQFDQARTNFEAETKELRSELAQARKESTEFCAKLNESEAQQKRTAQRLVESEAQRDKTARDLTRCVAERDEARYLLGRDQAPSIQARGASWQREHIEGLIDAELRSNEKIKILKGEIETLCSMTPAYRETIERQEKQLDELLKTEDRLNRMIDQGRDKLHEQYTKINQLTTQIDTQEQMIKSRDETIRIANDTNGTVIKRNAELLADRDSVSLTPMHDVILNIKNRAGRARFVVLSSNNQISADKLSEHMNALFRYGYSDLSIKAETVNRPAGQNPPTRYEVVTNGTVIV